jgi:hypothetical protein
MREIELDGTRTKIGRKGHLTPADRPNREAVGRKCLIQAPQRIVISQLIDLRSAAAIRNEQLAVALVDSETRRAPIESAKVQGARMIRAHGYYRHAGLIVGDIQIPIRTESQLPRYGDEFVGDGPPWGRLAFVVNEDARRLRASRNVDVVISATATPAGLTTGMVSDGVVAPAG